MKKKVLVALAAAVLVGVPVGATRASADLFQSVLGSLATIDPVTMFAADDPVVNDPANSEPVGNDPPHFPAGGKFKLFGTAARSRDPNNPYNEVVSFDTTDPNAIAGAYKKFGDHVKIDELTDMLDVKYLYVGRTCGGGSTRVQLGISESGDGHFDGNAFGYLGDKPFGGACPTGVWTYEDMTNASQKWDLSQLGGGMTMSWSQAVAFLDTAYPNHRVLDYVLVDDSGSFFAGDRGCAYFDLVSAGPRNLHTWDDASDGSKSTSC